MIFLAGVSLVGEPAFFFSSHYEPRKNKARMTAKAILGPLSA
jgi:hypothetical protein